MSRARRATEALHCLRRRPTPKWPVGLWVQARPRARRRPQLLTSGFPVPKRANGPSSLHCPCLPQQSNPPWTLLGRKWTLRPFYCSTAILSSVLILPAKLHFPHEANRLQQPPLMPSLWYTMHGFLPVRCRLCSHWTYSETRNPLSWCGWPRGRPWLDCIFRRHPPRFRRRPFRK